MKEIKNDTLENQLLSNSGYLNNFSVDVLPETKLFHFSPRDSIVDEGSDPTYLYYLVRGRAKLYVTYPNGKVALVDFFSANCFIGEIELIDKSRQSLSVQAIEDCWCFALPMAKYRPILLNDVKFLHTLCVTLCRKNHKNIASFTKNQSFNLSNRLAAFILLTQHNNIYSEKHTLVADHMAVSYRHLLYVISIFTSAGVLVKYKAGYLIKNKEKLTSLALEMDLGTMDKGDTQQWGNFSEFLSDVVEGD